MSDRNLIKIPQLSLIVLIGPSGGGKSTFAKRHFLPTEIISSDECRGLISDDPNDQTATPDAFDVLQYIAGKRLARGKLTVIDATNVRREDRAPLVALAREHNVLPVAIVLDTPEEVCRARNESRPDRQFGNHVVRNHLIALRRSLRGLQREGFRNVTVLNSVEQIDAATIERQKLWNDRRDDAGPFDIVGDIHGCHDELIELLAKLGYGQQLGGPTEGPPGRKLVFLGDLTDRGPEPVAVLRLVMDAVKSGIALCVPGNHDVKLLRALRGKKVQRNHGLAETMEKLEAEPENFRQEVAKFLDSLISHYVLDGGKLAVAHAGLKEKYIGRASGRVREFCLYGETTGEVDEFGLPERLDWARDYRGETVVVYGHTPVPDADWPLTVVNHTLNLDTGCCFGGKLSALRWPEREVVSVPAQRQYAEPARPIGAVADDVVEGDLLDLGDVIGKRFVETRLGPKVTVRAENAAAALEVMSRFAIDPRWLVYLPPTMSPPATSARPDVLEHPAEAFAYFRGEGVEQVICQAKHMGSRAVAIVCRDAEAAAARFGLDEATAQSGGIIHTRTGRRFVGDDVERPLLDRLRGAIEKTGLWDELATDWLVLDCELMPWSAKAQDLLRTQYAAVGSVAKNNLAAAEALLQQAVERHGDAAGDLAELLARTAGDRRMVDGYIDAYRRYCWPVEKVDDLRLAPFHLLAAEGQVFTDRDHAWHMATFARLAEHDDVLMATDHRRVDLTHPDAEAEATAWWENYTANGGEGMVVKPLDWIVRGRRGLVQPAVKVRGREYLRIIYGPTYTDHLDQLRRRGLGAKRSLATREFALGLEALHRFVDRKPLRQVHECVFGVLALKSEPVDPRL
jgi:protein phosphatase